MESFPPWSLNVQSPSGSMTSPQPLIERGLENWTSAVWLIRVAPRGGVGADWSDRVMVLAVEMTWAPPLGFASVAGGGAAWAIAHRALKMVSVMDGAFDMGRLRRGRQSENGTRFTMARFPTILGTTAFSWTQSWLAPPALPAAFHCR